MKTPLIAALLAAVAASAALPAAAAQVDARESHQAARINQGVRSGQLTRHEVHRLNRQQTRIARSEARMRARHGGRLTPRAHAKLERMQNHADRTIARAKHN